MINRYTWHKEPKTMKRVLIASACFFFLFATLQYGQTLQNEKLLYHAPEGVRWTQCAFGPDGVLWVIWAPGTTNDDSGGAVWVLSYDGITVSEPLRLTAAATRANRPHISASPRGYIIASWGIVDTDSTFLRIWDPHSKTWGETEVVCQGYGGNEPCAGMDKDGNIHVFFSDEAGGKVYARSKINGVWENIVKLNEKYGKQGALAVGPDGTAHAIWIEKGADGVYENFYTNRTPAQTWYPREGLPGEGGAGGHPWIAVGSNNKAVAAWQDVTDPHLENGSEIRVLEIGSSVQIAIPFSFIHFARVVIDKNNKIHVACQRGPGDGGLGMLYSHNINGNWSPAQMIGASMPKVPGLASDPFGNVAATMSSFNAPGADIKAWSLYPINKVPLPEASFTFSPVTGYPPLPVDFTAVKAVGPDGQEVRYDWKFGDGGSGSGRNTSHTFLTAGTYNVTLTITDNINRTDTVTKQIVVLKTNPLVPQNLSATITLDRVWTNPKITFNLFWAVNPDNIPEHIEAYAIYMKEDDGEYVRLLTLSPSTLSASFEFTDLKKKRSFAISTLGYGGTESTWGYFQ